MPIILTVIFAVHAAVFARIYLARGRRPYHLALSGGFVLLLSYYGYETWTTFNHAANSLTFVSYLRWSGIILCVAGLLWFAASVYSKTRARRLRNANSLDSKGIDY